MAAHGLKTHTVHETQIPPGSGQEKLDGGFMSGGIDPQNFQSRYYILGKQANRFQTDPALQQNECLDQHIVGGIEVDSVIQQSPPFALCRRVDPITRIYYGIKGRGVGECVHSENARCR